MSAIQILPLPALRLAGLVETVADEAEIGGAVRQLKERLGLGPGEPHVLVYDGMSDPEVLTVTLGTPLDTSASPDDGDPPGTRGHDVVGVEAAEAAVATTYPPGPVDVADAWLALDSAAAERGLRTVGPYRHTVHADGSATFAAPTREIDASSAGVGS